MATMLERGRMVLRGECAAPPIATVIDVKDEQDRLVARASSTCMTLKGERARGR